MYSHTWCADVYSSIQFVSAVGLARCSGVQVSDGDIVACDDRLLHRDLVCTEVRIPLPVEVCLRIREEDDGAVHATFTLVARARTRRRRGTSNQATSRPHQRPVVHDDVVSNGEEGAVGCVYCDVLPVGTGNTPDEWSYKSQ